MGKSAVAGGHGYKSGGGARWQQQAPARTPRQKQAVPSREQIQWNRELVGCWSARDVLQVVHAHLSAFNLVNCTTALHRLAKATPPPKAQDLPALVQRTGALIQEAGPAGCPPQNLANALWACCRLGVSSKDSAGLVDAARAAMQDEALLWGFSGQHVANIVWAVAKIGGAAAGDFEPFAAAIAWSAHYLNGQELSMVSWALATRGVSTGMDNIVEAVRALGSERRSGVSMLDAQQVATLAWALAKLGHIDKELFHEIAEAVIQDVVAGSFNAQDLASLAWAFGRQEVGAPQLFDAIGSAVQQRLGSKSTVAFSPRHLAMILWAFAKVGHSCPRTIRAILGASEALVADLAPRDLTDIVWAVATLKAPAKSFLDAAGPAAQKKSKEFNSQELLKFLGAFHRAGGDATVQRSLASEQRDLAYDFPSLQVKINLASEIPGMRQGRRYKGGAGDPQRADGRATGTALWEASFVLGEWLSRQTAQHSLAEDMSGAGTIMRAAWPRSKTRKERSWSGKVGVELGAGLGLPSIVAAHLGVRMVATDGDDAVLRLLEKNTLQNAPSASSHSSKHHGSVEVKKLLWSSTTSPSELGLLRPPDLLLAADVIYADANQDLTSQLLATLVNLSGPQTLVAIANVRRFPVNHPKGEGHFFSRLEKFFEHAEVPEHCLHVDFQRRGVGSCGVHILRLRAAASSSSLLGELNGQNLHQSEAAPICMQGQDRPRIGSRKRKRKSIVSSQDTGKDGGELMPSSITPPVQAKKKLVRLDAARGRCAQDSLARGSRQSKNKALSLGAPVSGHSAVALAGSLPQTRVKKRASSQDKLGMIDVQASVMPDVQAPALRKKLKKRNKRLQRSDVAARECAASPRKEMVTSRNDLSAGLRTGRRKKTRLTTK